MRRLLRRRLSTQVMIMLVAILVVTMAAGFAVVQSNLNRQLDQQFEMRSLAVAQSLAVQASVLRGVTTGHPSPLGPMQRLATSVKRATHAEFVVITDAAGTRYSHPNPSLIGKPVWYPDSEPHSTEPFRTGRDWMGIQRGTLGWEATGKAPIFDHGRLAGEVSVGFLTSTVTSRVAGALPGLAAYLAAVLALGVLAALGLARLLKRQTFGLELREIAALLQEREAMLHGIREGVLGYDKHGRVLLANDAARSLLRLPADFQGRQLHEVLPPGRLGGIASGEISGNDLLVLQDNRVLVANRMPIRLDHRRHLGWVVTFHDQTESESLKRELDEAIGLTEALRAQSHEFANRLHTLVGLVELGQYEEAIRFVTDVSLARDSLTEHLKAAIGDPRLVALILAKSSLADERAVDLRVAGDCHVEGTITDISQVLTVAGNLIDNAMEATAQAGQPRWVELAVVSAGPDLLLRVRDSGPGVPAEQRETIFVDGFTTKTSPTGAHRGLGLALVKQIAERHQGMVSVGRDGGAVFTVVLPGVVDLPADADRAAHTAGEPAAAPAPASSADAASRPSGQALVPS